MALVLDTETGALHDEIYDHLLDCHVRFVVLDDLLAVHLGDGVDVG